MWRSGRASVSQEGPPAAESRLPDPAALRLGNITAGQVASVVNIPRYFEALAGMRVAGDASFTDIYLQDAKFFHDAWLGGRGRFMSWGSKEVGGDPEKVINHFRMAFPSGKVVLVVRDPRFVVSSAIRFKRKKGRALTTRGIWHQCESAFGNLQYCLGMPGSENNVVVCYENLVRNTEAEMRRVVAKLGFPWDPAFLVPTTLGLPAKVTTASVDESRVFDASTRDWRRGLGAAERMALGVFLAAGSCGRWRSVLQSYRNLITAGA
jgi:hypothetical protein